MVSLEDEQMAGIEQQLLTQKNKMKGNRSDFT